MVTVVVVEAMVPEEVEVEIEGTTAVWWMSVTLTATLLGDHLVPTEGTVTAEAKVKVTDEVKVEIEADMVGKMMMA